VAKTRSCGLIKSWFILLSTEKQKQISEILVLFIRTGEHQAVVDNDREEFSPLFSRKYAVGVG
jgi:hypothetical protein